VSTEFVQFAYDISLLQLPIHTRCWVLNSYKEITPRDAGAGVIAIISLILFFIRLTKQQKQIDIKPSSLNRRSIVVCISFDGRLL
jgi:hypothetical protein